MTTSQILSVIGLLMDIIGVFMLFKFGLPPDVSRDGSVAICIDMEDVSERERAKGKKYINLSRIALTALFLGFVFQIFANIPSVVKIFDLF